MITPNPKQDITMTIRNTLFRFLALAVMLSVGAGTIWAMVFGLSTGIVISLTSSDNVSETLAFTRDSTPIIESIVNNNYQTSTYRTLDGKPLEMTRYDMGYWPSLSGPIDQRKRFFRPSWSRRIARINEFWESTEQWYLICDGKLHGRVYVVGYDNVTRAKIGYIGLNGFSFNKPPREEQFPVNGRKIDQRGCRSLFSSGFVKDQHETRFLLTDDGLMHINLKKRTAEVVRKETNLLSAELSRKPKPDAEIKPDKLTFISVVLLRMPDRVLLLDPSGKEIQTYLLPAELRNGTFVFIPLKGDKALVNKNNELFWIDTAGKITERKRVDLHKRSTISNTTQSLLGSTALPSVGIIGSVFVCYPWAPAESPYLGYWAALSKGLHMYWPMLLITGVTCVVLAILCYRRQRKYGLPWTWVWTGFVLFFGLPAYLGYLAHRSWPARLPCPSCGKLAPRDRQACCCCHHDFPAPAPKGTEVFA